MISYTLRCFSGHEFEAWFRSSDSYETQRVSGDVTCPVCGDQDIEKALMAPAIASKKGRPSTAEIRAREVAREVLEAIGSVRNQIEENCDYVGDQFADEARRIYYGETEERGIYGEATVEETQELDEEGIEVFQLPKSIRHNN
jgi:hypothetical protein